MKPNASMFYKVKFQITRTTSKTDLLWELVTLIKKWQTQKWNKNGERIITTDKRKWSELKSGNRIITESNIVYIESEYFSPEINQRYWACNIIENNPQDNSVAPREWITEIGFEQESLDSAIFSCILSYSDRAGFIGPYQDTPPQTIPRLIRMICDDPYLNVKYGIDNIGSVPIELKVGDWPAFLNRINDQERVLPYIYISPVLDYLEDSESSFLVSPDSLAKVLLGNAVVYYSKEKGFTEEMRYMNPEYLTYNGAIRVFQPGVNEVFRHRFLTASDIEIYGEEQITHFFCRAFDQNINFYDSFFWIDTCRKKKAEYVRKRRLEEIHSEYQKRIESAKEDEISSLKLAEEQETLRLEAKNIAESKEEELKSLKQQMYNLEAQLEQMRYAADENNALRRSLCARETIDQFPETPEQIIDYFSKVFGDKIEFSAEAITSSKQCTLQCTEVWKVMFALSTVMWDLYDNYSGDIYGRFTELTSLPCAPTEGSMTRKDKKLMQQFKITHEDEIINIEPHITYSKQGQSIHFGYSSKKHKVIVGHCGEHKKIYSSRFSR